MADLSKIVLPNNQEYNLKDLQGRQQISPIENSSISTSSYEIGEYLQLNGILYIVTAPVSIGDTITVNTNVKEVKVSEEFLKIIQMIADLGLSIVDGKLCITYEVNTWVQL